MTRVQATSRVLVVVGDPVQHSLSPAMHNAAISALGLAGNVTLPHKLAMAQLLIRLTAAAQELGAINTFFPEGGRLVGDNTDVAGLLDALDRLEPQSPWLVVGTGGSAP